MCISRLPGTIAADASPIGCRSIIPGRPVETCRVDILPTCDYWSRMNRLYSAEDLHWTFRAQPYPRPETLISAIRISSCAEMARQTIEISSNRSRALGAFLAAFRDPSRVHAMCEDYRPALCRFEIDRSDALRAEDHHPDAGALWGRCRPSHERCCNASDNLKTGRQC